MNRKIKNCKKTGPFSSQMTIQIMLENTGTCIFPIYRRSFAEKKKRKEGKDTSDGNKMDRRTENKSRMKKKRVIKKETTIRVLSIPARKPSINTSHTNFSSVRFSFHEVYEDVRTEHVLVFGSEASDLDLELGVRDLFGQVDGLSDFVRTGSDRALD